MKQEHPQEEERLLAIKENDEVIWISFSVLNLLYLYVHNCLGVKEEMLMLC